MPKNSALDGFLQNLRRAMLWRKGETDTELLARYTQRGDGAAFDSLMRRHGPMVLGVCRRLLRNDADAEDAFQATFLVLIRRAASIRAPAKLASWLYGVARKTALKARSRAWTRQTKERLAGMKPAPRTETEHPESGLLDEELQRLPDKYRVPIVVCELEGRTLQDAARHLGWPQGTVATRLARGRDLLAKRLTQRGWTMAGATLIAVFKDSAAARAAATTVNSTVKAATLAAAGKAVTAEIIPAHVAALTEGVLRAMFMNKVKWAALALLAVAGLLAGTDQVMQRLAAGPADQPKTSEVFKTSKVLPAAGAQKEGPTVTSWGEAAGGVMIRARVVKKTWRADEKPEVLLDLHNKQGGDLNVYRMPYLEVEVDKVWHVPTIRGLVAGAYVVHQGEIHERFSAVWLESAKWVIKTEENQDKRLVTESDPAKRMQLAPGKHTIRVACKFAGSRAVSNAVEIEIAGK